MSLSPRHLLERVIRPTLKSLGDKYAGRSAERLVLGTAAVESGFYFLVQSRNGPALGLWQMEPATHSSLWEDLLSKRPDLRVRVQALVSAEAGGEMPDPQELIWNLRYAAAMCRIRYLWDPHKLPEPNDVEGFAETWKRAYNSRLGAGRTEDFVRSWLRHCSNVLN